MKKNLKKIHIPLVLGLIQNLDIPDTAIAAERLQRSFYYDLNGGTGKWVQQKATVGGKYAYNYPLNVRSEREYLDFTKTKRLTVFSDVFLAAVSLVFLAAKIPQIVGNLNKLVNLLKLRKFAGMKNTAVVSKASLPVKAEPLKQAFVPEIAAQQFTPQLAVANTANTFSKIRNIAKIHRTFIPEKQGKLNYVLTSSKNPVIAGEISKEQTGAISESVFKMLGPEGQFSGFLTEIPVYGINRQVIVSVGHAVGKEPEAPVVVMDNQGQVLTTAHLMFSDFHENKFGELERDFALFLPYHRLTQTPLELDFNPKLSDYTKIWSIGYPNGKFLAKTMKVYENGVNNIKNLMFFKGRSIPGNSGGAILGEKQGKFFVLGTTAAKKPDGKTGITEVFNLKWLEKFINGKLDVSKLWAPNFRESFVKPGKDGKLPDLKYNEGITAAAVDFPKPSEKVFPSNNGKENYFEEMQKSVFKLENIEGQFTGYLAEVPIYGIKKQVIVTAGHVVYGAPASKVRVFDNNGEFLTNANTLFFNFNFSEKQNFWNDYALLLPEKNLEFSPINLTFNKSIYGNSLVKTIGFPEGNMYYNTTNPEPYTNVPPMKDIEYIKGLSEEGASGSPVLVGNTANNYSSYGTVVGYGKSPEGDISILQNLNWLYKFIHGQPISANFRFPLFPPVPFIKSNPKIIHSFSNPINILPEQIISKGSEIKNVSAPIVSSESKLPYSKVKAVSDTQSGWLPKKEGKRVSFLLAFANTQVNLTNKISKFVYSLLLRFRSPFKEIQNSVLKLEALGHKATGYVAEIPIYGKNKQVIITAGHFVSNKSNTPIYMYNRKGKFLGKAHTMLFNDIMGKNLGIKTDYALLSPEKELPLKPLNLDFNKSVYEYEKVIKIGYPEGKYKISAAFPDKKVSKMLPMKEIEYLKNESIGGFSGSPIIAETAPGKYSVLGTLIATVFMQNGETYTILKKFNWLERFIKGQPLSANFRIPAFPPVSFVRSNPVTEKFYPEVIDISELLTPNKNLTGIFFKATSAPPDRPYLPISDFDIYEKATLFPMGNISKKMNPVWGIYDIGGYINKFLMYGTETDVFRMRIFDRIIKENNLKGKYELVDIEYPEFVSVIEDGLPDNVIDDFYEIKGNNKDFSRPLLMPYTTTPIKLNGAIWVEEDLAMNATFREKSDFANKPITPAEWDEVLALIQDINNNDFIFLDFAKSILLGRNTQGKLIIRFIKLKDTLMLTDNYTDVISIGKKLEREGLKLMRGNIIQKPEIKPKNISAVLKNTVRAELVVTEIDQSVITHAVWKLFDNQSKVLGYLKYGTEDEIINTKKLHDLITKNNLLEKFEGVQIVYPQILAESTEGLPKDILKGVYDEYDRIKNFIRDPDNRAKVMFVVSPVDGSGFCWGNVGSDRQSVLFAHVKLNNMPITVKEWDIIFRFFTELEKYGFSYDDLYNNLFFKRDRDNNLIMTMIDFENEGTPNMLYDLQLLGNKFNQIGIKEKHYYWDKLALDDEEKFFPF